MYTHEEKVAAEEFQKKVFRSIKDPEWAVTVSFQNFISWPPGQVTGRCLFVAAAVSELEGETSHGRFPKFHRVFAA